VYALAYNKISRKQIITKVLLGLRLKNVYFSSSRNDQSHPNIRMNRFLFNSTFWISILIFSLILVPKLQADQNDSRLDGLFSNLKTAVSLQKALVYEIQIWKIWMEHQNPKVQNSMTNGLEAMQQQNFEKALDHFTLLIQMEPEFAEGWNKRATVLYLMGRFQESETDVLRTLELEPRHFGALSGQGLIRMALENWSGAVQSLEAGLRIHPHMPGTIRNLKYSRQKYKESMA